MKTIHWMVLALAAGACRREPPAAAAAVCPGPVLTARSSAGPLTLDGELSEPAWHQAQSTGAWRNVVDGGFASPHTELRAVATPEALVLGLYAGDQDVGKDDAISVRLGTASGAPLTLEVTPKGELRCPRASPGCTLPAGATLAVDLDGTPDDPSDEDEEWVVELRLPWKSLGYDGPPARLPLNAWRRDTPKGAAPRTIGWARPCPPDVGWGELRLLSSPSSQP